MCTLSGINLMLSNQIPCVCERHHILTTWYRVERHYPSLVDPSYITTYLYVKQEHLLEAPFQLTAFKTNLLSNVSSDGIKIKMNSSVKDALTDREQ